MKNILFLFVALIVAISAQSQTFRSTLEPDITYRTNNVNYVVRDTSSYDVQWEVRSHYPFTYSLGMKIDSILGVSGKDTLKIQGRIADTDAWATLGTVVPTTNSAIMRFDYTQKESSAADTIGVRYRYIRALYAKIDTSDVRVSNHWLKIWRE